MRRAQQKLRLLGPLTASQEELLQMRYELNEPHKVKAKLATRLVCASQVNNSIIDEIEDLKKGGAV